MGCGASRPGRVEKRSEDEERKKREEEHRKTREEEERKKRETEERKKREEQERNKREEEKRERETHIVAGEAAVAFARKRLGNGDIEEAKAAPAKSALQYWQAKEDGTSEIAELDNAIREEEERKKLEEEKKERQATGQALVEAAKGGKLPEITSILTRSDAQDFINYIHEGKESARCIYAASSVWWAARHGHLKTLEALIAAGADVNLAPRLLHDVVPASVRIAGAVGEKAARLNGLYDAVIDVDSYVQLNGKPALRKRDDPDTWLFFVRGLWAIATADKEANGKSCLCQGWHSAMAQFDEETGAVATCLRQHVMVAGVVGRKADQLNGVYEPTGDLYNGKPLFRKRNDPGWSCEWLRFCTDDTWMFSLTAAKDANQTTTVGGGLEHHSWCCSIQTGKDHPTKVDTWKIHSNGAKDEWEQHAPMKCIDPSGLDRPTQCNSWAIHANSTQDTGWQQCASMQCTATDNPAQVKGKLKVWTSEGDKELAPGPLFVAALEGHQDAVTALMEVDAEVSVPLFFAAQTGRADAISSLVLGGVDPNTTNEEGVAAILVAAEHGHVECIRELILGGADADATNKDGATAVFAAAQHGSVEAIKALLIAGADPKRADSQNVSPVFVAAQHGKAEAIATLLLGGADPNAPIKDSITPTYAAAQEGHAGAITALFKGGANVNTASPDGVTPTYAAAERGHVEAVKALLECGAGPNIANKDNITPAYIAAQEGHDEVIEALVRGGANVNIASSLNGQTPVHVAAHNGHVNAVIALFKGGGNLNAAASGNNETPTYLAAKDGQSEVIKALLQGGAKVNEATSDKNYTPLYIAAQNGHNEALTALLQGGADVNIATTDGNYTPIHAATLKNDLTALKALLQGGGDVNIKASDGLTPLDIAQKNKFIPAAVMLRACRTSEASKLWSEKEAAKVWDEKKTQAAKVSRGEHKFSTVKLIVGSSADSVLKRVIGLQDSEFAKFAEDPLQAIREEWLKNGNKKDKETMVYIFDGKACRNVPSHVLLHDVEGSYHGGDFKISDFDEGHDGRTLEDFVNLEICRLAGLKPWHVAVLRMYTSSSFHQFNVDLRRKTNPHPFKLSIYYMDEALRMMRSLQAQIDPEGYNQTKVLYRGMADVEMDLKEFQRVGGTELAMMSTTEDKATALSYAFESKESGIIFRYATTGHTRGISIRHLSLYPKEQEFLYPPLTNLTFDKSTTVQEELGVTIIPIVPTWS